MLTKEQKKILEKSHKEIINGWSHVTIKGTPYELGFQNGYHLSSEYEDAIRVYTYMTMETFGMEYSYFKDQAVRLHKDKIPNYQLEELQGMADGLTAAGVPSTLEDLIGWNDWMEITGY